MGRSRETYLKKEVRTKKEKKRKEKEKKRISKKEEGKKGDMNDMIAYVDENGNITSTPPDPSNKSEVLAENIQVSVQKATDRDDDSPPEGKIKMYDDAKGFGFIQVVSEKDQIFFHRNDCIDDVKENDQVIFDIEKGPKGFKAVNVKLKN